MHNPAIDYITEKIKSIPPELLAISIVTSIITSIVCLIIGFRLIRTGVIEDKFWKICVGVFFTGLWWGVLYYQSKKDQIKKEVKEIQNKKLTKEEKIKELKKLKNKLFNF